MIKILSLAVQILSCFLRRIVGFAMHPDPVVIASLIGIS
jgi:hypothetical protein